MRDFIFNIQVLYVLVKIVLVGSIVATYLNYIDYNMLYDKIFKL